MSDFLHGLATSSERYTAVFGRRGAIRLCVAVAVFILCLRTAEHPLSAQDATTSGSSSVLAAIEDATIAAIESSEHSVVAIARVKRGRPPAAQLDSLGLGNVFPFEDSPDNPDFVPTFFGSGVLLSQDGFIVTCAHVVDDPRENSYFVWLDKQSYTARVVGKSAKVMASDPFSDLAVLKIDSEGLQPARFSREKLRKGQFVIALGNPQAIARDGEASASWGIVANLNRIAPSGEGVSDASKETIHQYGTLIQTDAKLNFGMSGGALVNMKGEVIGLTTALAASSGFERSAGFAIATDAMFLRVVEALKLGKLPEYGFLGIQPEDLRTADRTRGLRGARVSLVLPGLPGEMAGLRADDVIFQVDEQPIEGRNDLFRELSRAAAGEQLQLNVQRLRPGRRIPDILQLTATMSKKPLTTTRPAYALNGQEKWRGMLVDYATAVPPELTRGGLLSGRRGSPKLAILSVEPDTAAWKAGLRQGYGVVSVDGQALESPADFYRLVDNRTDRVAIVVVRNGQRPEAISVAPEP